MARAGYKVAVAAQGRLNCWEDRLCLKRVNVCEADSWIEIALKMTTGKDFRQRTKEFLMTRGLHRRLDQA